MSIIDTTNKILSLANECEQKFVLEKWRKYADCIKLGLANKLEQDASHYVLDDVLYYTERALHSTERLQQLSTIFAQTAKDSIESLSQLGIKEFAQTVDIILYLGMCNGAGWATKLDNTNTVLIGVEKVFELDWDKKERLQTLICHELAHCWQSTLVPSIYDSEGKSAKEAAILQLYCEGVAMYIEKTAGGDKHVFNQDKGGWLSFCQANKKELFEAFAQMAEVGDVSSFFGDWEQFKGYGDIGYYLGFDLVSRLVRAVGFEKAATLDTEKAVEVFNRYIKSFK